VESTISSSPSLVDVQSPLFASAVAELDVVATAVAGASVFDDAAVAEQADAVAVDVAEDS